MGHSLLGDPKLKLRKGDGTYTSFVLHWVSPHWIRIATFNPPIVNDSYTIEYDGRDLFNSYLQCPPPIYDGIYYIDSMRQRSSDLYNNVNKKIPNPTIRTGYLGE
jgi:hypothetical protein